MPTNTREIGFEAYIETFLIDQNGYEKRKPENYDKALCVDREVTLRNFDHPDAIEWELLAEHMQTLQSGNIIAQPQYSMLTCLRENETTQVKPNRVLIVEGILVLTQPIVRDLMSLKIFIDADADHRFMRVVKRDMEERGRNIDQVMQRYLKTVRPMHETFIEPSKKHADIIVPIGGDNHVAIDLLTGYIRSRL